MALWRSSWQLGDAVCRCWEREQPARVVAWGEPFLFLGAPASRRPWPVLPSLLLGAVVVTLASSSAFASNGSYTRVGVTDVPVNGDWVSVPLPRDAAPEDLKIIVHGSVHFDYDGNTYYPVPDDPDKQGFIAWSDGLTLVEGESSREKAILRFAEGTGTVPMNVRARVDREHFVRRFVLTPSEVVGGLSGNLTLEVYRQGKPMIPIGLGIAGLAVLGLLAGGIVLLRREPDPNMRDVDDVVRRIDAKYPEATAAIDNQRWDAGELRSQLKRLRDGAHDLAAHVAAFRRSAARVDRNTLDAEIARAETQLEGTERADLRQELEATLETKRKVKELLGDTDANEARYVLRLSKIESAIDATTLQLAQQGSQLADSKVDHKALDALAGELKSLDEAIAELSVLEEANAIAGR